MPARGSEFAPQHGNAEQRAIVRDCLDAYIAVVVSAA
jgi:hypothetical protein